jgi:hypothetical protein
MIGAGIGITSFGVSGAKRGVIGTAGTEAFGVGVYPYATLPDGISAMDGTSIKGSDNYGNYQYTDGSVCVFIPAFYYRIGSASSPLYATYGLNAVDIASVYDFADEAAANAAGYVLHRAFIDGGATKSGFFIDKYVNSQDTATGITHGSSLKNGVPISLTTSSSYTRSNGMTDCNGQLHDAITLSRARGSIWQCMSAFQQSALALLSLAHGQAATGAAFCAWYDAAGTINFPKGCNNNALADANDATVTFTTAGDAGSASKPLAGSASILAKTTHNGQNCGVTDLNGTMWEINIGVTTPGVSLTDNADATSDDLWVLKPSVAIRDLTNGWNGATDAWQSAANIGTLYDQVVGAMWWGATTGWIDWGNGANQSLDPAASGVGYHRTSILMPKDADGTSGAGSNLFGQDSSYRYRRSNLALLAGGGWNDSSSAGVFARYWNFWRSFAIISIGFRASAYGQ